MNIRLSIRGIYWTHHRRIARYLIMSKETTLATFKINPVLWDGFKIWATTHGTNAAEVLRYLIKECIEERIAAPDGVEAHQQAIAGIDERIDSRLVEKLSPLLAELAELRRMVEKPQRNKRSRSVDGAVSDVTARAKAKALGWSKATGESVEAFLGRHGWTRTGYSNKARWFPPK
jgi:hypothetical protein